jgi:hypothetical protein
LPYCDFHARRAFQPPQPRRRDREVFAPVTPAAPPVSAAAPAAVAAPAVAPKEKAAV